MSPGDARRAAAVLRAYAEAGVLGGDAELLMCVADLCGFAEQGGGCVMGRARRPKPEARWSITAAGRTLRGEKWAGAWTFSCPDWPDLAERHHGAADTDAILADFLARCRGDDAAAA